MIQELTSLQRERIAEWLSMGGYGDDGAERSDDAIVKLTDAAGHPIATLNAAWLKSLLDSTPEPHETGWRAASRDLRVFVDSAGRVVAAVEVGIPGGLATAFADGVGRIGLFSSELLAREAIEHQLGFSSSAPDQMGGARHE